MQLQARFDAVVRNIVAPNGLKEILVPSWSLVNGQDDLVWHKASKQADGSYRVTIKASDHKHSTGKYRADVYLVDKDGNRQYLTETVVEVNETKPSGSISILNNNGAGTFDVVISDVYSPKGFERFKSQSGLRLMIKTIFVGMKRHVKQMAITRLLFK